MDLPEVERHGITCVHSWGPIAKAVAVDLPGHGQSEPCQPSGREGFDATLAALARTVDELRTGPVDVLGYSQGARLALGLALEWPGRVRRLILESGTAGLKRSCDRTLRGRCVARPQGLPRQFR